MCTPEHRTIFNKKIQQKKKRKRKNVWKGRGKQDGTRTMENKANRTAINCLIATKQMTPSDQRRGQQPYWVSNDPTTAVGLVKSLPDDIYESMFGTKKWVPAFGANTRVLDAIAGHSVQAQPPFENGEISTGKNRRNSGLAEVASRDAEVQFEGKRRTFCKYTYARSHALPPLHAAFRQPATSASAG